MPDAEQRLGSGLRRRARRQGRASAGARCASTWLHGPDQLRCAPPLAAMCAVTGILTASGCWSDHAWLETAVRVRRSRCRSPWALFALRRPPFERFGALLLAAGCRVVHDHAGERGGPDAVQHRRVSAWVFEPLLIYLLLAFPTGRIENGASTAHWCGASCCSRADPLPADGVARRELSGARAVDELRERLSRRTRSWSAARSRPSSRMWCARCASSSRSCSSGRSPWPCAAHPQRDAPQAARARARGGRGVLPLRGLRRVVVGRRIAPESGSSRYRCGCSRSRCR